MSNKYKYYQFIEQTDVKDKDKKIIYKSPSIYILIYIFFYSCKFVLIYKKSYMFLSGLLSC